jgi:hypothetical protein
MGFRDNSFGSVESGLVMTPQRGDRHLGQVAVRLEPRDLLGQDELETLGFFDDQPEGRRTESPALLHGGGALDEIRTALTRHALPVQAHVSLTTP